MQVENFGFRAVSIFLVDFACPAYQHPHSIPTKVEVFLTLTYNQMLPEKETLFWQNIQIDLKLVNTYQTKMNFAVTRIFDGRAIASCGMVEDDVKN